MNRRGFVGSIKLDYKEEKMELRVRMGDDNNKRNVVKNMKSLSGGERSFTTVCFMLALARVISSPFHCMDEFDVFMDAINRRVRLLRLTPARSFTPACRTTTTSTAK